MHDKRIALVLRDAWKVHRLDVIREVVQRTMDDLGALKPHDLLARETLALEESESGPVRAAFEACCAELRAGCCLTETVPTTALTPPKGSLGGPWVHSYSNALERYREMAHAALRVALDGQPAAGSLPPATAVSQSPVGEPFGDTRFVKP